tara:strand:- start:283 stop:654 length:372 start_codon:yes stop_codon:yes gene_type:complete
LLKKPNHASLVYQYGLKLKKRTILYRGKNMIVMLTQDLSKGFVSWKEMYFENKDALEALGGRLIFAGPQKEDDNKMVVLIDFDSPEAMKAFATNEELKAKRVEAGAILESNVVTVMGDESFTS